MYAHVRKLVVRKLVVRKLVDPVCRRAAGAAYSPLDRADLAPSIGFRNRLWKIKLTCRYPSHKYSVSVYNFARQTHTVHAQVPIDHCVSERLNDNVRSGEARFPKEAPRLGAHFKTHALLAPHVPLQAVEKAGNFAEGRRNMGSSTMPQRDTFHRSRGQAVCATRVA